MMHIGFQATHGAGDGDRTRSLRFGRAPLRLLSYTDISCDLKQNSVFYFFLGLPFKRYPPLFPVPPSPTKILGYLSIIIFIYIIYYYIILDYTYNLK